MAQNKPNVLSTTHLHEDTELKSTFFSWSYNVNYKCVGLYKHGSAFILPGFSPTKFRTGINTSFLTWKRTTRLLFSAWFPSNFSNYWANSSLAQTSRDLERAHRLHTCVYLTGCLISRFCRRLHAARERRTAARANHFTKEWAEQFNAEQDDYCWLTQGLLFPSRWETFSTARWPDGCYN